MVAREGRPFFVSEVNQNQVLGRIVNSMNYELFKWIFE
jgi:hypothetical protein